MASHNNGGAHRKNTSPGRAIQGLLALALLAVAAAILAYVGGIVAAFAVTLFEAGWSTIR